MEIAPQIRNARMIRPTSWRVPGRRQWPLEGVEVKLHHDRIHASDCADCDTRDGFLDRISKELTLRGPLDESQRARLAEIAERCPVQRTLQREVKIEQHLSS